MVSGRLVVSAQNIHTKDSKIEMNYGMQVLTIRIQLTLVPQSDNRFLIDMFDSRRGAWAPVARV